MELSDQKEDQTKETDQMVIFRVAGELFASKISSVREIIKMEDITPVPSADIQIAGIINIRGRIVPVMSLANILAISLEDGAKGNFILLTDDSRGGQVGVIVNEVIEIRRFKEEEVKPAPTLVQTKVSSDFIDGVILPEGKAEDEEVILLLNLATVLIKSADKLENVNSEEGVKNENINS